MKNHLRLTTVGSGNPSCPQMKVYTPPYTTTPKTQLLISKSSKTPRTFHGFIYFRLCEFIGNSPLPDSRCGQVHHGK